MQNSNATVASDFGPIIVNMNDLYISRSITQTGYWAMKDIRAIKTILDKILSARGSITYYDVGANIGTHSLAFAKIFKERISIRSFEAQRQIYYMLCGTMALNGLRNVHCHNNAVSAASGQQISIRLPDYAAPNNFGGIELTTAPRNSEAHVTAGGRSELVTTVALDDFDEHVDFMKIDIEGMEIHALNGARRTFETRRPVAWLETLKSDREAIYAFFRNIGYVGQQSDEELIAFPEEMDIAIPAEKLAW